MQIDRRHFLIGSLVALSSRGQAHAAGTGHEDAAEFVSACRRADGRYAVVLLTRNGRITREIALGGRGHDVAVDRANGRAVVFARRPGFFAVAFDLAGRGAPLVFAPEPNRHFFGHGVFADGGRLLLTTEHDIETGQGLIGIYDANGGFRREGELATHGIGPHEVILLADGRTLAVANGGIATDPATGRENFDLSGMKPSLAFLDWQTGALLSRHDLEPELNMLSLRHIAESGRGDVWFGAQWQGSIESAPALIGSAGRDKAITILAPSPALGVALKGYVGSVAISGDGRYLAASAPRAGRIVYVDTETGRLAPDSALQDGCGLAGIERDGFALSSGLGDFRLEKPGKAPLAQARIAGVAFDNHLRRVL